MINYSLYTLTVLIAVFTLGTLQAQQPETFNAQLEFKSELSDTVSSVAPHNPIWTYQGYIYQANVNRQQEIVLTQKTPKGKINRKVIFKGVRHDNHNSPSIAVDQSGYIHIVGDLHNGNAEYQWSYWTSDKPHDISSFTFRGGQVWKEPKTWLPSNMPSYTLFRPDNNDQLYVTWRGRILSRTDVGSYRGVMLATLPTKKPGPWTNLGAYHPERKHWPGKGIAWEDHVRPLPKGRPGKSTYQTLRGQTWFDKKNHLHMAWVVFGPGSQARGTPELEGKIGSGASHMLYAKSKDGGKTWVSVRDRKLTLPIQLKNKNAVVLKRPGDLTTQVFLTTTKDNRPIISFTVGGHMMHGEHYMIIADKRGRWSKPMKLPTTQWENYRLFADRDGVLTLPGTKVWWRSYNEGKTWVKYEGLPEYNGGGAAHFDYRHLRETGEIRFHNATGKKGKRMVEVWTVKFKKK